MIEGTPDDALDVLLLMRSGSTMVGESRSLVLFRNISPSPRPCCPEALIVAVSATGPLATFNLGDIDVYEVCLEAAADSISRWGRASCGWLTRSAQVTKLEAVGGSIADPE